jgi:hypothetical protein
MAPVSLYNVPIKTYSWMNADEVALVLKGNRALGIRQSDGKETTKTIKLPKIVILKTVGPLGKGE